MNYPRHDEKKCRLMGRFVTRFARDSPFSGMKQSGPGREWGQTGFAENLETRVIGYPLSS